MPGEWEQAYLLDGMLFEWDSEKAALNVLRHGISFEEAATVFGDERARIYGDPDRSEDESRFLLVGRSRRRRLLIIVSVERGRRVRLIRARQVTRRERLDYEADED